MLHVDSEESNSRKLSSNVINLVEGTRDGFVFHFLERGDPLKTTPDLSSSVHIGQVRYFVRCGLPLGLHVHQCLFCGLPISGPLQTSGFFLEKYISCQNWQAPLSAPSILRAEQNPNIVVGLPHSKPDALRPLAIIFWTYKCSTDVTNS